MGHFMNTSRGNNVFPSFEDVTPSMLSEESITSRNVRQFDFFSDGICKPSEKLCRGCQNIDFNAIQKTKPRRIHDLKQPHCSRSLYGTVSQSKECTLNFKFSNPTEISCELCRFVISAASKERRAPKRSIALGLPPNALKGHEYMRSTVPARLRIVNIDGKEMIKPANVNGPSIMNQILRHERNTEISIIGLAADRGAHGLSSQPVRRIGSPGSDVALSFIQSCLANCEAHHDECKRSIVGHPLDNCPPHYSELPTRVIDVFANCPSGLRLLETKGEHGRFATLSHRWGSQKFLIAKRSTLQSLCEGIDFDALSRTFQDAVLITQRLDIQFLWIDSLCIVQDDRGDWTRESEKMGLIYENAYINFAATGQEDTLLGFLGPRLREYQHIKLPWSLQEPEGSSIYFTDQPAPNFEASVDSAELNNRGWVLQERILSRRTVHFARDQIYWECASCKASEGDQMPSTTPRTGLTRMKLSNSGPGLKTMEVFQKPNYRFPHEPSSTAEIVIPHDELERAWGRLLVHYSLCKLTYASDKLAALQGLAHRVQERTKLVYLFGHFFNTDHKVSPQLMWYVEDELKADIPNSPRAPTWSCLATDGPLSFFGNTNLEPLATLVWENCAERSHFVELHVCGKIRTALKGPPNGVGKRFFAMFANQTLGPVEFDDPRVAPDNFTCLLMFRKKDYGRGEGSDLVLILQEVDKRGEILVYRRIGLGHVHRPSFYGGCKETTVILI